MKKNITLSSKGSKVCPLSCPVLYCTALSYTAVSAVSRRVFRPPPFTAHPFIFLSLIVFFTLPSPRLPCIYFLFLPFPVVLSLLSHNQIRSVCVCVCVCSQDRYPHSGVSYRLTNLSTHPTPPLSGNICPPRRPQSILAGELQRKHDRGLSVCVSVPALRHCDHLLQRAIQWGRGHRPAHRRGSTAGFTGEREQAGGEAKGWRA